MGSEQLVWRHPGVELLAGVACTQITPPQEIYWRTWGAARHDQPSGVHRPLELRALVLRSLVDSTELILLEGDLSWWDYLDTWRWFHAQLLEALEAPPECVWFALTHTHAVPTLRLQTEGLPGGELVRPWLERLLHSSVELVHRAQAALKPCVLEWHQGTCRLACVRDLPDPQQPGRVLCGFNPQGEPDQTLLVGRLCTPEGSPVAVLVNYACHPTTLAYENRLLSPDFVGAMRQLVAQHTGAEVFFLQGASGELAPRYQYVGDPQVADRHGRHLGYAVLATLQDMEPPRTELRFCGEVSSGAPLGIWKHHLRTLPRWLKAAVEEVPLELKPELPLEKLRRQWERCHDRAQKERLRRRLALRSSLGSQEEFRLPVWAWRTGEALWIGTMAEAYSLFQRRVREHCPHCAVICLNLLNGTVGYLVPRELYQLDLYQANQSPFQPGALEKTLQVALKLSQQLLTQEDPT